MRPTTRTQVGRASPLPAAPLPTADGAHGVTRPTYALLLALFFATVISARAAAPVVTGVTAVQQAFPSKLVNISYTLSDADSTNVSIYLIVSSDSGATWTVPASTFTGHHGVNVAATPTPTAKSIVWDAGADWDGQYTTNCRVRVLANDLGLSLIPTGNYLRGNPPALGDTISDAQQYSVFVSAFYMDRTHVTGGKWNLVKEGYADSHDYAFDNPGLFEATTHPVYGVNWFDAVKWCNARSQMEGVTPVYYLDAACTIVYKQGQVVPYIKAGANGYRLPTEAEWEKAARGGLSGKRFPWGDTITHSNANYFSSASYAYDTSPTRGYHPAYTNAPTPYTSPVGSFPVNGYGLSDMAGNVWSWCWDWYGGAYYASGQSNPQGASSGSNRVLRGGAWNDYADFARCAYRNYYSPSNAFSLIGFRCVRGL